MQREQHIPSEGEVGIPYMVVMRMMMVMMMMMMMPPFRFLETLTIMKKTLSPQVDSLLSDGIDPSRNVRPHSDFTESGEYIDICSVYHNVLS